MSKTYESASSPSIWDTNWLARLDEQGQPTFTYTPEYVKSDGPRSRCVCRLAGRRSASRSIRTFCGLLPENASTRQQWVQSLGIDSDDTFWNAGGDGVGLPWGGAVLC